MKIRKLFAAAALSAGLAVPPPGVAAEPAKKPAFGFSTLKAATPEAAKAKAEAWLKSVGKFDQAAFDKVWADESRTVLDRTADSLALGNTEAAAILADVRKAGRPGPGRRPRASSRTPRQTPSSAPTSRWPSPRPPPARRCTRKPSKP